MTRRFQLIAWAVGFVLLGVVLFAAFSIKSIHWSETNATAPMTAGSTAADDGVIKVVYHADFADPRRFSAMLQSINNMVTTYQEQLVDYDVRVVYVAHGIRFVTEDKLKGTPFEEDEALKKRHKELAERVLSLQNTQQVKMELCGITQEQVGLDSAKLLPGVKVVRSGVVQIAELQRKGFAYIKIE